MVARDGRQVPSGHNLSSSVEYFPVMFVVATVHTFKFSIVVEVVAGGEEFLM